MALPRVQSAVHTLTIPSTKKVVKFKPFTVKEQKALMIAQQTEDQKVMVDTLKAVITSCVIDEIDVESLATFDIEYIFMQLRAKSVGEIVELNFSCDECEEVTMSRIDISKIAVTIPEGHTNKIELTPTLGIVLKYPGIDMVEVLTKADNDENEVESVFKAIIMCIDYIYDEDQIYYTKEQTKEEVIDFLESLSIEQFTKIQTFFETLPKMQIPLIWKCPKCGHQHDKIISGINNFF